MSIPHNPNLNPQLQPPPKKLTNPRAKLYTLSMKNISQGQAKDYPIIDKETQMEIQGQMYQERDKGKEKGKGKANEKNEKKERERNFYNLSKKNLYKEKVEQEYLERELDRSLDKEKKIGIDLMERQDIRKQESKYVIDFAENYQKIKGKSKTKFKAKATSKDKNNQNIEQNNMKIVENSQKQKNYQISQFIQAQSQKNCSQQKIQSPENKQQKQQQFENQEQNKFQPESQAQTQPQTAPQNQNTPKQSKPENSPQPEPQPQPQPQPRPQPLSKQQQNPARQSQFQPQPQPQQDDEPLQSDNKLYNYFVQKCQILCLSQKIQKQKINGWEKLIKSILMELDKKIAINEKNILKFQSIIANGYRQIHGLYREIQRIKLEKIQYKNRQSSKGFGIANANMSGGFGQQAKSRRKRSIGSQFGEKLALLKENIQSLKKQLKERDLECMKIKKQFRKMEVERKCFILQCMRNGIYFNNGIQFFLIKLGEIGYKPQNKDFYQLLDTKSRQFLQNQYDYFLQKNKNTNLAPIQNKSQLKFDQKTQKITNISQVQVQAQAQAQISPPTLLSQRANRSKSNTQLSNLLKFQNSKDIYYGTKDYIMQLLLKQEFKKQRDGNGSGVKFPKIGSGKQKSSLDLEGLRQRRREMEKKRSKLTYSSQIYEKVKKVLFGCKLQTIFP